ncbi:hypothetical protein [Synechococcus sp. NOUM97013]|uniref:hypothetical protein n=1 Tax=Synechococcus sp. NOUM97013 TaxID=1442555 RepID=UPI001645432A|nr:hypothetical protein [Synechococcus sp. NOUM97013]QNI73683.1 hypothetical protein SynNOUM97013_01626 [Synechococcus sp. NOUM97013]
MSSRNLRPLRPVSKTRRVFTNRQPRRQPSIGRQFGEAVLLLALGAGTLAFLSWLPQKNEGLLVVSEAIADLIAGIGQLLEGLLGLTVVIVVALLLVGALLALVSGVIRLFRSLKRTFGTRAPKSVSSTPRRRRKRR